MPASPARVSVIIATYNWSSALRCAITSVLLQTVPDFELLVVGDGCTDDTEEIVRGFCDSRIRWLNLPSNSGGQSAPNNAGIDNSTAPYIAYLGHDDIWFPTHLESLLAKLDQTGADLAGAMMILYGPPGSGVRGLTGVFPRDRYSPCDFMPPSSILHKRDLVAKIGRWQEPQSLSLPADVDFLKRAFDSGAALVSSGELTVFKFNAAWRRNSYLIKSAFEQEQMLARIQSGIDFRQAALVDVLQSVVADKFVRIQTPEPRPPGEFARINRQYKGADPPPLKPLPLSEPSRFYLDGQLAGFEWHALELDPRWTSYRWSGPAHSSTLEFPVLCNRELVMEAHILMHFQTELARDVHLLVDGIPVEISIRTTTEGTSILCASIPPNIRQQRPLSITFRAAQTQRPADLGINDDRRWLGIAVNWVEFY